jgi:hypothetical protein
VTALQFKAHAIDVVQVLIPSCGLMYNLLSSPSAIGAKAKLYLGSQLGITPLFSFYATR